MKLYIIKAVKSLMNGHRKSILFFFIIWKSIWLMTQSVGGFQTISIVSL